MMPSLLTDGPLALLEFVLRETIKCSADLSPEECSFLKYELSKCLYEMGRRHYRSDRLV